MWSLLGSNKVSQVSQLFNKLTTDASNIHAPSPLQQKKNLPLSATTIPSKKDQNRRKHTAVK